MSGYLYDQPGWPNFRWDHERIAEQLAEVRYAQGRLMGRMESLAFESRQEALLDTVTEDVLKTSDIEGEKLDAAQVRSSVARHLGMDIAGVTPSDRGIDGIVEMMLDATERFEEPLTAERLFGWHALLFPSGHSGMSRIAVGAWRDDQTGRMRVVSGPIGREHVHFEAPAAERVDGEMRALLDWFNGGAAADWVLTAGIAHLWFVTVHPFDDGNGRIARVISDLALARSERSAQRFYSMSAQIRRQRSEYYQVLERTERGTMDVTLWLGWFLGCLGRAIDGAEATLAAVLAKARFWEAVEATAVNERQRLMLNRLLEGFEGKLTTSKWAKIARCSSDTALRDIQALVERGILIRGPQGGRSTGYELVRAEDRPTEWPLRPGDVAEGVQGFQQGRRRRTETRPASR